ncbi:MAG: PepSY domain-containing protein [Rhodobacter sp.]|nr:PepSY domain-containing protein [Paracoccaceae bacterium]MCC0076722.1 PepSY domain-containing protein [Rhodobacter sp.]
MTRLVPALALVVTLALPQAAAASFFGPPVPDEVRATIVAMLEERGYQVFTVETERGGYEVVAARDGRLWELRLNAGFEITRAELED